MGKRPPRASFSDVRSQENPEENFRSAEEFNETQNNNIQEPPIKEVKIEPKQTKEIKQEPIIETPKIEEEIKQEIVKEEIKSQTQTQIQSTTNNTVSIPIEHTLSNMELLSTSRSTFKKPKNLSLSIEVIELLDEASSKSGVPVSSLVEFMTINYIHKIPLRKKKKIKFVEYDD